MSKASEKVGRAKAALVIEQPFYATLVCAMPMHEDASLNPPTLATDGVSMWYHPQWIEDHTDAQVKWALCHETSHCVFKHMLRRGQRNPGKWNRAGDYIINDLLEQEKSLAKARPPHVLFDPDLVKRGNGTTDGVYNLLPDDDGLGLGAFDECRDTPGDAAAQAEAEAMWGMKIAQAAGVAKARGQLSSAQERFVGEMLKPKVVWQDVLRRFCMQQVRSDRSFARPSRRWLHQDLYMPGLSGVGMGDILVAVDCSGSIGPKELAEFATELVAIKEDATPSRIHVVYFADSVSKYDVFERDEELVIVPGRSGGTNFSPIFRFAEQHDIHPDCCVVLTDLCCNDFGPHPDYPVLWVTNGSTTAPWGEVIEMKGT